MRRGDARCGGCGAGARKASAGYSRLGLCWRCAAAAKATRPPKAACVVCDEPTGETWRDGRPRCHGCQLEWCAEAGRPLPGADAEPSAAAGNPEKESLILLYEARAAARLPIFQGGLCDLNPETASDAKRARDEGSDPGDGGARCRRRSS